MRFSTGVTALSLALSSMLLAQAGNTADAAKFAFEVASIRQNVDGGGHVHIYNDRHNGEFRTVNAPLKMILVYAYELPRTQMVGGPAWVDSTTFNIDAKAEAAVSDALAKMQGADANAAKQGMVRKLLAERFGLVVHRETREMPVFDLVVAKDGPRFAKSDVQGTTINEGNDHIDAIGSWSLPKDRCPCWSSIR